MIRATRYSRRPTARSLGLGILAATILLAAAPAPGADIVNTAIVMSDSGDPRQSTWITPLRIRTDLGLSIAAAPNPIVFGNEVTITLRVENFGPSNSDGFSVELQLPDEVSFDSSLDNCSPDTGGAVCGSSFIEVGSSIDFRVVLTFPESFAGPIFGDARVYPDNIDQVDENDSASVLIPIDRPFFFDNFEDGTLDAWSSIFPTP